MSEQLQYPFAITPPRLAGELRPGDLIAVIPEKNPAAQCQNCQGLRTMMVWQIQEGGPCDHHIEINQSGKTIELPAKLYSGPCPVCRPGDDVPEIPSIEAPVGRAPMQGELPQRFID